MTEYGQFCPVAKATEIIGYKWTVLILRELLLGSTKFSELQRGLSRISPTLLSKRLKMLEQKGLLHHWLQQNHDRKLRPPPRAL